MCASSRYTLNACITARIQSFLRGHIFYKLLFIFLSNSNQAGEGSSESMALYFTYFRFSADFVKIFSKNNINYIRCNQIRICKGNIGLKKDNFDKKTTPDLME